MKKYQKWTWVAFILWIMAFHSACSESSNSDESDEDAGETEQTSKNAYPYLWGAGVGVTDLDAAVEFYTKFMDMEVESTAAREDRDETVLWAKADRGSRIVLMKFKDGRDTQKINGKLVFAVADVKALHTTLSDAGYETIFSPITIGGITVAQLFGPEDFLIEITQMATSEVSSQSFLISLGFGASDLNASEAFYTDALGMEKTGEYPLGTLDEVVMEYPTKGGAGLVLQHYTSEGYKYKDNPIKHVHHVPDPAAVLEKITQNGGSAIAQVGKLPQLDDKTGAIAKDPDGYLIEIIEDKKGTDRSVAIAGAGGSSGGTGGSGGTSGDALPVICNGEECTTPPGSRLNACCVAADQSCGLGMGDECQTPNMPGTDDERCPSHTFQTLGITLVGCCKPDNKCGVRFTSGLGCVERTEVAGYVGGPLDELACDAERDAGE
ncbi:MAG: VOC family protein [Deltaproteobacteria bacterium]|nr:VOC family protein [Deltaproteobacteria bacterium]